MKRRQFASSFFFFYAWEMPENTFALPSFAKINLLLRVSGKRADGFHELCTVFQTVSLRDYLTFGENKKIVLTCDDAKIPAGDENLIVKAAKLLQTEFGVTEGAKIHLEKKIPAPGGLGGGSSNAATALIGIVRLWELKIEFLDLCELGKSIGSDVPFFFYGGTAIGTGRGTEITQTEDFQAENILIVTPNVDVSTKDAFARMNAPDLTNKTSKSILKICRYEAESLYLRQSNLKNDFEATVFELYPETARVKKKLLDCGAEYALLSGSGASVFAIFDSDLKRREVFDELQNERAWRVFAVETISRQDYQNQLNFGEILHS
ncbi:MAG: 4-(cytidine 5'-diphospho)-2-C-methyl-D-erythritol kinase [Pyrinomonadaceae bacterium]|nr:4-(cytidine 5'-diphospho)-2-C-methyl-D-erythritol kinase [Pyrinomonadaceae bacterium]